MANYTRQKGKFGGVVGSIIVHSSAGLGSANDPDSVQFKDKIPAGYLRCDGSVLNCKEYLALSRVLGEGTTGRFAKSNSSIREPDLAINDLGQFQLPDLGSKVIIGGRGTGIYSNDIVDRGIEETNPLTRVGPQITVVSNFGDRIESFFEGNARMTAAPSISFIGNPRYNVDRSTSETELNIENFQGHGHQTQGQRFLNYTANHKTGFGTGKDRGNLSGNSGAYNQLDEVREFGRESIHKHNITRPFEYNHDFTYGYGQQEFDMSGVSAYIDVDVSNDEKLDELSTPFILVEYLIKF